MGMPPGSRYSVTTWARSFSESPNGDYTMQANTSRLNLTAYLAQMPTHPACATAGPKANSPAPTYQGDFETTRASFSGDREFLRWGPS